MERAIYQALETATAPSPQIYRQPRQQPLNPNRMTKVLRPWYTTACRHAKHQLLCTRRTYGVAAAATRAAAAAYHATLRMARRHFASQLEGLRLCNPRDFWRLLRPPPPPLTIAPHLLHAHYTTLLGAASPAGDTATSPLTTVQV